MNGPAGTWLIAPEVVGAAQRLDAYDKGLLARATVTCPMEHTSL